MKTIATLTAVGKTNGHCTTTAFHTTNMPMHHIRLPQHISACSMDTTHTHTLRRSTELTIVQISKSWNGQQVENMTSILFLLALHHYRARTKHTHGNMHTHYIQVLMHIGACSMDTTHTHTLRRSTELTTVQINKSWNGQQVENMTSIPFLLALHCYKVCTKHAHAPHSSERARRCVFVGHHSYIQLVPVERTINGSDHQILEHATGGKYDKQPDSCLHFTATKCAPTTLAHHFQVNVHAGARSMYTTHTYNSYQCIPTPS